MTPRAAKPAIVIPARPDWETERGCHAQGYALVAGCDEVGRGAWAGPLVAAAVIFPPALARHVDDTAPPADPTLAAAWTDLAPVRDSKQLTPKARERLALCIRQHALAVGIGQVSPGLGDVIGWGAANRLALLRAVRALAVPPDYLLLDAFGLPGLALPQLPLIKGDARCISIAAASIIAKVHRDALLVAAHAEYPAYDFATHKGYGTAVHAAALAAAGPSPLHRRTFAPVRNWGLGAGGWGRVETTEDADQDAAPDADQPDSAIRNPHSALRNG
jgi:ribonuclease HII